MTQSIFFLPASLNRSPAACPAIFSSWPTWAIAPNSVLRVAPELIVTTGMPASTAASTDALSASGFAIDTTSPVLPCATALSMSLACAPGSPLDT